MSIALLVPCYNAEAYLPRLAAQISTIQPQFDEVILANDGSTDDTASVARDLGFTVLDLETNRGPGGARNCLAKAAKSDWIHFLDCDDFIDASFVAEVIKFIGEETDVVLCAGDFIDEVSGALLQRWQFESSHYVTDPVNAAFKSPVPSFCSTIRRQAFLDVGGFDEARRCWEDGDLHLRLAVAGARFRVCNKVLSISPRHGRGASGNHLYCHTCRLAFLQDYIRKDFPLDKSLLNSAVVSLGYLFLSECELRSAWHSYSLIEEIGAFRATTNNVVFRAILHFLPVRAGHFVSAAGKISVGRLKRWLGKGG